jgi:S-adenosylmethionine:tRNA-ribosyltransferase-isomerase (queuine synthetase)
MLTIYAELLSTFYLVIMSSVNGLVTNFHQPGSTLLMLVAAFCGGREKLLDVYDEALRNNYRFLSYGDSSVFLPDESRDKCDKRS